ncbi:hypothetical protein NC796_19155 [Aliifodinibius sp. S!AR15-10]|uniref:LVIVD repeat-containing protein n=1 Tax=Aliifodinibius sp. S!AR15-10 TaxID=2950437 RepID=UPI0028624F6C|nr:hypothetical protein [Aliifodinibius sp. S!AR15-10]MDR8393281.1 hypothetical protein [Aliifodinibius sp. S!AR15-10]
MRVLTNLSSKFELKQIFFLVFVFSLGLMGCEDKKLQTIKRVEYEPIYMTDQEFKNAVAMETPRELGKPGKIYFYNDYLFVNETNKGVHIIDNSDPSSPSKVGFINIPSNKDIAVKGDRLYADSHSDLLVFNIEDLQNPELIKRIEDVFSFSATMVRGYPYQPVDNSKGIVVDWKKVEVEEICQGDCYYYERGGVLFDAMNAGSGAVAESGGNSGVGGSMARFAITGDYLYAVDDINLVTFDISDQEPTKVDRQDLGWAIETIFPHEQNLYIGSESAMYIFDITTPETPKQMSIYTHLTACDPVVVEGNHAFVTLRQGERCPRAVNRLEVIDVQDPYSPQKIAFYEMISPHGLGIDNGNLFVSEGEHGLKVMDASDPRNIKLLRHIKDLKTYDVIPYNNVLMVTGESGIVQYDYSDIENLNHLSTIPVGTSAN